MSIDRVASLGEDAGMLARLLRFTLPFNFSRSPTITMRCGFADYGVPIGFQLVAPPLGEDRLITAGRAFQQATDWHQRRPI